MIKDIRKYVITFTKFSYSVYHYIEWNLETQEGESKELQ